MMSRSERLEKKEKQAYIEKKKEKKNKIKKGILKTILYIFIIFLLLILYMHFIGTKGLEVREYKVENKNLPESFHGFKVVQFSDLHYLTTIGSKEMKKIVNKINELKADIVVFTGDLIDNTKNPTNEELDELINLLNEIEATTGLYTIKGNHDYSNDYFEKVFNQTNFKILDNSYDYIYYKDVIPIVITGVGSSLMNDDNIELAFNYEDDLYTISLIHEPDIIDNILRNYNVDLALAGHSHNGQIRLPIVGSLKTVDGGKKYPEKEYTINNTKLFISGGLGTSMYEFRFFNRPSISLYRLVTE